MSSGQLNSLLIVVFKLNDKKMFVAGRGKVELQEIRFRQLKDFNETLFSESNCLEVLACCIFSLIIRAMVPMHSLTTSFLYLCFIVKQEHKRVWASIQGTDLLHFKHKRSHRFFFVRRLLSMLLRLNASRSEHKGRQERRFFNDSHKRIMFNLI